VSADRPPQVAVVIPAKDEEARISATVRAARAIPEVGLVVVVDDGSTDGTGQQALAAGAEVIRHPRNRGKAAAIQTGVTEVSRLEAGRGLTPHAALLFIDADLQDTAANTAVLVEPVLAGRADLTIAVLPSQKTTGGGRGFVVRLARAGILRATGWTATQPLSGMRGLTRSAFEAARPLARGWGVETGMTIDLLLAGYRVVEVPCELHHRVTGADWRAQLHRAGQYRDVALALAIRRLRKAGRTARARRPARRSR
jgi:glycosyltransferase involved in cell wall biosynthesis